MKKNTLWLKNKVLCYGRLLRAYWTTDIPTYIVFFVTARCNARCPHCFYWWEVENAAQTAPTELTYPEIEKIARNFNGLIQISLTGGEPFLRKDFAAIIKAFYQFSGTRFFTISTHGGQTERMHEVLAEVLPEMPEAFFRVSISVDDIGEAHDRNRWIPHLSEKIKATVGMLNQLKTQYPQLAVSMCSTMTSDNQSRLPELYTHIKNNFAIDDWGVGLIRGTPKDHVLKNINLDYYIRIFNTIKNCFATSSWVTRQLRKILLYEHTVKLRTIQEKRQVIPCLSGRRMVVLRENGKVEPCEMLDGFRRDSVMGNLRDYDYSIRRLLASAHSQEIQKFISDKKCHCTYECALHCSIFYNPSTLVKSFFHNPPYAKERGIGDQSYARSQRSASRADVKPDTRKKSPEELSALRGRT